MDYRNGNVKRFLVCLCVLFLCGPSFAFAKTVEVVKKSSVPMSGSFLGYDPNDCVGRIGDLNVHTHTYDADTQSIVSRYSVVDPSWAGFFIDFSNANFRPYSRLIFRVRAASAAQNPGQIKLEISDHDSKAEMYITNITTWDLTNVIDFALLPGITKNRIKQIAIVYEKGNGFNNGVVYYGNMHFD